MIIGIGCGSLWIILIVKCGRSLRSRRRCAAVAIYFLAPTLCIKRAETSPFIQLVSTLYFSLGIHSRLAHDETTSPTAKANEWNSRRLWARKSAPNIICWLRAAPSAVIIRRECFGGRPTISRKRPVHHLTFRLTAPLIIIAY